MVKEIATTPMNGVTFIGWKVSDLSVPAEQLLSYSYQSMRFVQWCT